MAFRLQSHPRTFNKPLRCQMGLHPWKTVILGGRPYLVCESCGANVFKEVHEKTYNPGTEPRMFKPHVDLMEARRLALRQRILDAMDKKDLIPRE